MPTKYEYAYVEVTDEPKWITDALADKGDEGWELAAVAHSSNAAHLYFKRVQYIAA